MLWPVWAGLTHPPRRFGCWREAGPSRALIPFLGQRLQPELSLLPAGPRVLLHFPIFSWAALRGQQDRLRECLPPQEEVGILPPAQGPPAGAAAPHLWEGPKKTLLSEPGSTQGEQLQPHQGDAS